MKNEILILSFMTVGIISVFYIMYKWAINRKRRKENPRRDMSRIGAISKDLFNRLKTIEPNRYGYYPCSVILNNGQFQDYVYIVDRNIFIKTWGYNPEEEKAKRFIKINDIADIRESPSRLPSHITNKLNKSGETKMGSVIATYVFSDATKLSLINAHDFIEYPDRKTANDLIDVIPHKWDKDNLKTGPQFYYSIYDGIKKE